MGKMYTTKEIKNLIESSGYTVVGDIVNMQTKVKCVTNDGYYVMVSPSGLKRRGDKPDIVSMYNPFSIENIKIWIIKNKTK